MMKYYTLPRLSVFVALFISLTVSVTAYAGDASYQAARDQIRQGELASALGTLKKAVDAEPKNKLYAQEFMLLRQMVATQKQLDREKNPNRWTGHARRLRTYFEQKQANIPLLELDKAIYAKSPGPENAILLAESLIAADQGAEAIDVLNKIDEKKSTALSRVVTGLALLHAGKTDDARKLQSEYQDPKTKEMLPNPVLLRLARLEAGLGDRDNALATLKRLFEQTPASQQIPLRESCPSYKEFEPFSTSDEFVSTLKVASTVPESDCSGGTSCGSCPMRSKCQGN